MLGHQHIKPPKDVHKLPADLGHPEAGHHQHPDFGSPDSWYRSAQPVPGRPEQADEIGLGRREIVLSGWLE